MALPFTSLRALLDHGFDTLIDVRSPAEFAEDHIEGAINLPALTNAQRAEVGTIYTQVSAFDGRRIGAAMVARNVAVHLEGPLSGKDGSWRPLIYCWRGGQRSGSVCSILSQIGWRADTVEGGYQAYRKLVHDALYDDPFPFEVILLDGNTGTAKTAILHRLKARGLQVIDLEGLAHHRGSLLGDQPEGQPSQKAFEGALACALATMDPDKPVLLEAESSKIGDRIIPPQLWAAMKAAPRIEVSAALGARADFLVEAYADMIARPDELSAKLDHLRRHRGHQVVDGWQQKLAEKDLRGLAIALIQDHYDPSYQKARAAQDRTVLFRCEAPSLAATGQEAVADSIAEWLAKARKS